MFNLEQAVDQWCRSVVSQNSEVEDSLDELKDHLYCVIECLQANGMDAEAAFNQAVQRFGNTRELIQEYAKNKSWQSTLCQFLQRIERLENNHHGDITMKKQWNHAMITNAIAWAAAMISTAIVLSGSDHGYAILMLLIICSVISTLGVQRAQGNSLKAEACHEWRWIRQKLAGRKAGDA